MSEDMDKRFSDDESSSAGESDSDSNDDDKELKPGKVTGVAMKSLLSFYGIQENASSSSSNNGILEEIQRNPGAYIDLPLFDANAYVKKLLLEAPLVDLLHADTKIVQEIKNLDSDMQMLVYENYNKFISATETIKRMKVNVEVMDEDMVNVKQKMGDLCKVSKALDDSLHDQRMKVDKIMRIKRLLSRLEFLTELPERLQEMISKEMYQKAVTLYNKTINVLTKHSGVLSLKNIKERTELMMIDLRAKVTNHLDDPLLDTTKLTQYVTVLRMMQAPKPQVVQKLMSAHVFRAKTLIKSFQLVDSETSSNSHDRESKNVSAGLAVSRARKFHQSLTAGLIEACKGIHELFCNSQHILADGSTTNNVQFSAEYVEDDVNNHASAHKALVAAVEDIVVNNYSGIMISQLLNFFNEYREKSEEVKNTEKLKSLTSVTPVSAEGQDDDSTRVYNDSNRELSNKEVLERNLRLLQLQLYHLEEESQNWLLLARQSILDLKFLHASINDCAPTNNGNRLRRLSQGHGDSSGKYNDSFSTSFAKSYSNEIFNIISSHVDYIFWRRVLSFIPIFQTSAQSIVKLGDLSSTFIQSSSYGDTDRLSSGGLDSVSSHGSVHGGYGNEQGIRSEIHKRTNEAKIIFDKLFDTLVSTFADIMTDIKPMIEVFNTLVPSKSSKHHGPSHEKGLSAIPDNITGFQHILSSHSSKEVSKPVTTSSKYIRNIQRNVLGVDMSPILSNELGECPGHDYVMNVVWSFCAAICQALEACHNVSYGGRAFSTAQGEFIPLNDDGIWDMETYGVCVISHGTTTTTEKESTIEKGPAIDQLIDDMLPSMLQLDEESILPNYPSKISKLSHISVRAMFSLIASAFLRRISPTILRRLDTELKNMNEDHSHVHMPKDSIFKAKCGGRLELCAQELLRMFVESSAESARNLAVLTINDIVKSVRFASPSISIDEVVIDGKPGQVSSRLYILCQLLHSVTIYCYIILGESPPVVKGPIYTVYTPHASQAASVRRHTMSGQGSKGHGGSRHTHSGGNVHLDIERLFSQKIKIYNYHVTAAVKNHSHDYGMSSARENQPSASTTDGQGLGTSTDLIPSLDVILGTIVKVVVKTLQELSRQLTIPRILYSELQMHISFLKQVSGCLLRESMWGEVEGLLDQLNSSMFSRYIDANNISHFIGSSQTNHHDGNEASQISKIVSFTMQDIAKQCLLIPKHI